MLAFHIFGVGAARYWRLGNGTWMRCDDPHRYLWRPVDTDEVPADVRMQERLEQCCARV